MDLRTAAIGMPLHGAGQASDPARIGPAPARRSSRKWGGASAVLPSSAGTAAR